MTQAMAVERVVYLKLVCYEDDCLSTEPRLDAVREDVLTNMSIHCAQRIVQKINILKTE